MNTKILHKQMMKLLKAVLRVLLMRHGCLIKNIYKTILSSILITITCKKYL